MKEVIERAVIIHPPFRRGMFPTGNQERRVGIMVFKLDKWKMISPGEFAHLQKRNVACDWVDIREMDLPLCDADKCYGKPGSKKLSAAIESVGRGKGEPRNNHATKI